jgi:tRNA dimethylallyltransferase
MATQLIVFIVGPTASGKSSLAMELARKLNGEIVCADSQTIRRGLDIGTAKPSKEDQAEIRHHMLDIIGPYDSYSVNQFKLEASKAIRDIQSRYKVPIVVGGTGLYINALFFDYDLDMLADNNEYKHALGNMSVSELKKIIAEKGYELPTNTENPRHLIGTILREGKTFSNTNPISGACIFGLLPDDMTLKKRINDRIEDMFTNGFVDEVKKLVQQYGRPVQTMDAIGYPLVMQYIDGEVSLEEMKQLFKSAHWQYARRQKSWFKTNQYITWLNNDSGDITKILQEVKSN